jgi:hypothetical protein
MRKKEKQQAIALLGGLFALLMVVVLAANSGGGTAEQRITKGLFLFYFVTPVAVVGLFVLIAIFLWKNR